MICPNCKASVEKLTRNIHLPENSTYLSSDLCLTCIIQELKTKQRKLYPVLAKKIQHHEQIKAAYHESSRKLTRINDKFKQMNYEQNIITHNINMEKAVQAAKANKSSKPTKPAKSEELTGDQIQAMLANLSSEQRAAIMQSFIQAQSS